MTSLPLLMKDGGLGWSWWVCGPLMALVGVVMAFLLLTVWRRFRRGEF